MDYDVKLDKDGNKIKFSHDSEKYPDPNVHQYKTWISV